MKIAEFIIKIKRREIPFYDRLYRIGKSVGHMEIPYIKGLHDLAYNERKFRVGVWRSFWRIVYHQPLFRSRCIKCGKRLHVINSGQGLPLIDGNLRISIGDDVIIYDRISLAGLTIGNEPRLIVGNNTQISEPIAIYVGNEVSIGSHCIIGCTLIADNPGHNLDYRKRSDKIDSAKIGKVHIGDYVYCGNHSQIIGNVTIGIGSTIGASTIVTKDIPPFCLVIGNPGKIVKKLPFPEKMIEKVGEDAYNSYLNAKVN
jgi:acetyltransferase-like isoleucine patch superfamily enzyme